MKKNPYNFFFKTLANPQRLKIVHALINSEKCVNSLVKELKLEQSMVSHHLKRLSQCQFVHIRKSGPFHYYSLNKETIQPLLQLIDRHVNRFCKKTCIKYE